MGGEIAPVGRSGDTPASMGGGRHLPASSPPWTRRTKPTPSQALRLLSPTWALTHAGCPRLTQVNNSAHALDLAAPTPEIRGCNVQAWLQNLLAGCSRNWGQSPIMGDYSGARLESIALDGMQFVTDNTVASNERNCAVRRRCQPNRLDRCY